MKLRLWLAVRVAQGTWDYSRDSAGTVVEGALLIADALIEATGSDPNEELNLGWRQVQVGEAARSFAKQTGDVVAAVGQCWAYDESGQMCGGQSVGLDLDAGIMVCAKHAKDRARVAGVVEASASGVERVDSGVTS